MDLIVRLGEREERVQVTRREGLFEVRMGERTWRVDRVVTGPSVRSLLIEGRQAEVSVQRESDGRYWVSSGEGAARVLVADPLTHLARVAKGKAGAGGPEVVTAYMPGRVVSILVEEGKKDREGQGIVVLEAMKMENEIQAERAGKVKRILVEPGQAVEGGDPLFELE